MRVLEVIRARRAVRDYTAGQIPERVVRELIDAAIQAPSAMNSQPWAFVVVQDRGLLKALSEEALALMRKEPFTLEVRELLDRPGFNIFHNAGTLIVICAKPKGLHPDWDCCFAAENLMLAARELGLGTCPIGFAWKLLEDPGVKSRLGIPVEYRAVVPIVVGNTDSFPAGPGRESPEILSWKVGSHVQ